MAKNSSFQKITIFATEMFIRHQKLKYTETLWQNL